MWLRHKSFKDIVKSEWNQAHKSSWVGLQFHYKLNCLKYRLKDGTRTLLAIYFKSKTNCLPESSNLTEKKQKRAFGSKIVVIEVGLKKSLCKLLPVRKLIGDKKTWLKWLQEGGDNTKFFHTSANARWTINRISDLYIDGSLCDDPFGLKKRSFSTLRRCIRKIKKERPGSPIGQVNLRLRNRQIY